MGGAGPEFESLLGSVRQSQLKHQGPMSLQLSQLKDRVYKAWQNRLKEISVNELDTIPVWGRNSGDAVGSWSGEYKPSAYLPALENLPPQALDDVSGRLQAAAPGMDRVDEALKTAYPNVGERGQIITRVREALAKGGIAEVRRLVELGVLPAIVLSVFGATQVSPGLSQSAFGNGEI